MITNEEQILHDILADTEQGKKQSLKDIMRRLRAVNGGFSDTEAILHMMDALIIESTERRGW